MTQTNSNGLVFDAQQLVYLGAVANRFDTPEVLEQATALVNSMNALPNDIKDRTLMVLDSINGGDGEYTLDGLVNGFVPGHVRDTGMHVIALLDATYQTVMQRNEALAITQHELDGTKVRATELGDARDTLQQQYDAEKAAHGETRGTLDDIREQSEDYQRQLSAVRATLVERTDRYSGLESDLRTTRTDLGEAQRDLSERTAEREAARGERTAAVSERDAARTSRGQIQDRLDESNTARNYLGIGLGVAATAALIGWGIIAYGGRSSEPEAPRVADAGIALYKSKNHVFTDKPFDGGVKRVFKKEAIGQDRDHTFTIHEDTMLVDRATARREYNARYGDDNELDGRITFTGGELFRVHKDIAGDDDVITMSEAAKALNIIGARDGLYTKKAEDKK